MINANDIVVAIDLGSDSVKLVFAYPGIDGNIIFGKLEPLSPDDSPFPAIAFYDEKDESWTFGEKVFQGAPKSFKNIVKIKDLLSLLIPKRTPDGLIDDSIYYYQEKEFPKFYFPNINRQSNVSYSDMIKNDRTFQAIQTPEEVCEMFFLELIQRHCNQILERLLRTNKDLNMDNIKYVALYPGKARSRYIKELTRLIANTGVEVSQALSSAKAVGLFAYNTGYLTNKSHSLVVDIGETDLSLVKIQTNGAAVTVDGADAHNEPLELGGSSYDELLRDIIEYKVARREVLGRVNGEDVDFVENGTHYQQFLLMNNIKNVKEILALPDLVYLKLFMKGVPINAERDVTVETRITRGEFLYGMDKKGKIIVSGANKGDNSVSNKIADYILNELKRPNNKMITDIILSGGTAQTYGLTKVISNRIQKEIPKKINVISFDERKDKEKELSSFDISEKEYAIYASALGGAILGTQKYSFKTVAALSYGTWNGSSNVKKLSIFLKKGSVIPEGGGSFWVDFRTGYVCSYIDGDEIFSTYTTENIIVGEPGSMARKRAIKEYGLKVISGELKKGRICFARENQEGKRKLVQVPADFIFSEGIEIDSEGRAVASVRNIDTRQEYKDIIVYIEGLNEFGVQSVARETK